LLLLLPLLLLLLLVLHGQLLGVRYKQDIALMRQLGLKHFRLSISWSRLLPGARKGSPVNPEAAGFYGALLAELQASGNAPASCESD